jgi:hypothetical protein
MNFLVFEGEKKLADVVARAYGKLGAAQRRLAEASLLRANPELESIKAVGRGTVLVVPPLPGARPQLDGEAPIPQAVAEVSETLRAQLDDLAESARREGARLKDLGELVGSRRLRAELGEVPEAIPYLDRVRDATKERAAEQDERLETIKRMGDAEAQLAELAERLRMPA